MVDSDIFQDFNRMIFIQRNKIILESKNLDYSIEIPFLSKTPTKIKKINHQNNVRKVPIKAIYGIIQLEEEKYIMAVTKASVIGQIYHRKIYQIDKVQFIPIADKESSKDKIYIQGLLQLFERKQFYYSDDYDLTNSVETFIENSCSMKIRNSNYFYNEVWIQDFIKIQAYQWITGFISGLVVIHFCTLNSGYTCQIVIVSRRDKRRQGCRWICRGSNLDGNTANTVETQQIFYAQKQGIESIFSFVQTRGSMPFKWVQKPDLKWSPKASVISTDKLNTQLCKKHFEDQKRAYPNICILNLVDKKGSQKMLGSKFQNLVSSLNDESIKYVWFDFHAECKNMKYQNLSKLLSMVQEQINKYGYFHIEIKGKIISRKNSQKGVFRSNCMDCLDRTNVVQSVFARNILHQMLNKLGITKARSTSALQKLPDQLQEYFRYSWTKNADTISILYSGTPAMKTDFTLTGKRTKQGALMDGYYAVKRYFLGNFYDSRSQDFIDLSVGKLKPKKNKIRHSFLNSLFIVLLLLIIIPFLFSYAFDNHLAPHARDYLEVDPHEHSTIYKTVGGILSAFIIFKLLQMNSQIFIRKPVLQD